MRWKNSPLGTRNKKSMEGTNPEQRRASGFGATCLNLQDIRPNLSYPPSFSLNQSPVQVEIWRNNARINKSKKRRVFLQRAAVSKYQKIASFKHDAAFFPLLWMSRLTLSWPSNLSLFVFGRMSLYSNKAYDCKAVATFCEDGNVPVSGLKRSFRPG